MVDPARAVGLTPGPGRPGRRRTGGGQGALAVWTPKAGSPKVRVPGRSRKAIATASPALAVRGPVSTPPGGIGRAVGSPEAPVPRTGEACRSPSSTESVCRPPRRRLPPRRRRGSGRRRRAGSTWRRRCWSAAPRPSRRCPRGPPCGRRRGPHGGRARPRCPSRSGQREVAEAPGEPAGLGEYLVAPCLVLGPRGLLGGEEGAVAVAHLPERLLDRLVRRRVPRPPRRVQGCSGRASASPPRPGPGRAAPSCPGRRGGPPPGAASRPAATCELRSPGCAPDTLRLPLPPVACGPRHERGRPPREFPEQTPVSLVGADQPRRWPPPGLKIRTPRKIRTATAATARTTFEYTETYSVTVSQLSPSR